MDIVEKCQAMKKEREKQKRITVLLSKVAPYLKELSVSKEEFCNALMEHDQLIASVEGVFRDPCSREAVQWMLMPLKVYNPDYFNKEMAPSYTEHSFRNFCHDFATELIEQKRRSYRDLSDDYDEEELQDAFSHDDIEKVCLMIQHIPAIYKIVDMHSCNLLKPLPALSYVARQFPIDKFLTRIHYKGSREQYMKDHFSSLLLCDPSLLYMVVNDVNEHHYDLTQNNMDSLLPVLEKEKYPISQKFLSNFLLSPSVSKNTRDSKIEVLPIIAEEEVLTEGRWYEELDSNFWFYMQACKDEKDSMKNLQLLLKEYVENRETFQLTRHIHMIEQEVLNRMDHPQLSQQSKDLCLSAQMSEFYSLLLTDQFISLPTWQKEGLLSEFTFENLFGFRNFNQLFGSGELPLQDVEDPKNFASLVQFLCVDDEEQFNMRKNALHSVSHQFSSIYLDSFIDYLSASNLKTKKEYKAHVAYFKKHSIDTFFESFQEDDNRVLRILFMKTEDKHKKKEQLRFCKKATGLQSGVTERICDVLAYSNDLNQVKSVVDLAINPLLQMLVLRDRKSFWSHLL